MSTDDRLAEVCWSYGTTAVSPHDDRDPVERRAELLGRDLGEDRAGALAHVGRAGVDDDAAVGQQAHGRVRQPGRRPGLQPDREPATPTGRRRRPPADHLGGPLARASRPVAVGRRVAGDERARRAAARLRSRSSSGSMPSIARRLVHVRFDRPDLLRVAEATERGRGHGVRQDAAGDDPGGRAAVRPRRGVAALGDGPIGDVGVRADQVVRARCRGTRASRRAGTRTARGPRPRRGGRPGTSPRASARGGPAGRSRWAMNASSGSYLACCLPPNAPPGSGAWTRTLASGRSSSVGDDALQPVRVLDRAPDRDAVAVGRGHERVRLDRELGDHRERVGALDDDVRRRVRPSSRSPQP